MNTKKETKPPVTDLVRAVADLLTSVGLHNEVLAYYYTDERIIMASKLADPKGQRHILNSYWNQQLLKCPEFTVNHRLCLVNDGEVEDWLRLFHGKIIPFCIDKRLPVQL
jgi:hypothetical protein